MQLPQYTQADSSRPHRVLGGDPRVEPAPRHRDRERVLRVDAARLHALVAEDAARVVAHVQLVVDLHGLVRRPRRPSGSVGHVVMAGLARVPLPRRQRRPSRRRTAPGRPRTRPSTGGRRASVRSIRRSSARNSITSLRECCTRSVSVLHLHAGLGRAAARRHERARPSTSTTQTRQAFTGVRLSAKHSVGVSTPCARQASRIVAPSGTRTVVAVDLDVDQLRGGASGTGCDIYDSCSSVGVGTPAVGTPRRRRTRRARRSPTARRWRPSARGRRSTRRASPGRPPRAAPNSCSREPIVRPCDQPVAAPPPGARCRRGTARTGRTTRRGRTARCAGTTSTRSTVPSNAITTPEPERVAAGARVLERERHVEPVRADEPAGRAAQQHRLQRPPVDPAGELERLAQRDAVLDLVHARAASTEPDRQNSRGPVESVGADRRRTPARRSAGSPAR